MKKIVIICGPTAAGKTGAGVHLAKKFNGEMVSADSQQVYRGMDVGTAKDGLSGTGVKCHLIDIVDPDEPFDAAKFVMLADSAIDEIIKKGKVPFVVGGTGLYIKALTEGLCEAPSRDEAIRKELFRIREEKGQSALYEILRSEDPLMAEKLHKNDVSRIIRAIEVKRLTGESVSVIACKPKTGKTNSRYDSIKIGLNIDRNILYDRINGRVDQMIENGLVDEVKRITEKYGFDLQSLKAVGYKEIIAYLRGEETLEEAIELTKRNTRRFAKRQLTWFRADKEIKWFEPDDFAAIREQLQKYFQQ